MKRFLALFGLFSLLAVSAFSQIWERAISKKAGETITLSWPDYPDVPVDGFAVYRQAGVTAAATKIASLSPTTRIFTTTMPAGTTQQYRFRVVPFKGSSFGPASNETVINRAK